MKTYVLLFICLFCVFSFCMADDYIWYNPSGGSFGDPGNWNVYGVPQMWDRVFFPFMNMPYTVTMDAFYQNIAMYVDGADLTLNLNGNVFNLDCDPQIDRSVYIGRDDLMGLTSSLTLNNNGTGGWLYSREISIGYSAGAMGYLTLTGPDAYWTTSYLEDWHGVWIGEEGDAHLSILDSANFSHGHGFSAFGSESEAVIEVDGTDSEWYVDGQFDMSIYGNTTVDISNGGMANIGNLSMGLEPGSSAEINIHSIAQHESELQLHAEWENSLTLGKNGQGTIRVYGSKIGNMGTMTIAENPGSFGRLDIHEGSWVDCSGSAAVGGSLDKAGGIGQLNIIDDDRSNEQSIDFTPTSEEGQYMKVWPQGTITMDGGVIEMEYGPWQANSIILQGGTLQGSGMIWAHVENRGGTVIPSDDQDQKWLEIGYNYTQDAMGTLKIAIGGWEAVRDYPVLWVNQSSSQVSLDGMLDVDLTNGFVPDYEDEFTIITATHITGTFNNAVSQYVFERGRFDIIYNTDSVVLTHYSSEPSCSNFLLADLNKDCRVNLVDFSMFASQWLECSLSPESYCSGGGE